MLKTSPKARFLMLKTSPKARFLMLKHNKKARFLTKNIVILCYNTNVGGMHGSVFFVSNLEKLA
ncbi:hypothetical protein P6280_07595 [Helicobacter sp. 219-2]|uniref:hypothetical protein n=1 Tax=Helicobacter sp. 219-2 TaxID=3037256 RepID=UPI0024B5F2B1|nr:hypothetical protein [Helicobacter sp. 219-2]MDI9252100.1 hypothetical protein [Helicobacter sp. 219-2]